jgi:hypothetical protein
MRNSTGVPAVEDDLVGVPSGRGTAAGGVARIGVGTTLVATAAGVGAAGLAVPTTAGE